MISLRITHIKDFMQKFLSSDLFDCFLLEQATIQTYNQFSIDGRIQKDFFPSDCNDEELLFYEFSKWKEVKPYCYQLIKGKYTPLSFKFVLQFMPEFTEKLLNSYESDSSKELLKAFVLTIRFNGSHVDIITGTSYQTFSLDKSPEKIWDKYIREFLELREIHYKEGD